MNKIQNISAVLIGVCFMLGTTLAQNVSEENALTRGWQGKGIKIGFDLVSVTNETGIGTAAKLKVGVGPSLNGYLTYQINPKLAFQPEIILSQRGYHRSLEKEMFNQALSVNASAFPDYLNLNPLMVFSPSKRLDLFAGPTLGTIIGGQTDPLWKSSDGLDDEHQEGFEGENEGEFENEVGEQWEDDLDEEREDDLEEGDIDAESEEGELSGFDAGLIIGTEYSLGRISLSVRYTLGLYRVNDPTIGPKNNVVQVFLWYKF